MNREKFDEIFNSLWQRDDIDHKNHPLQTHKEEMFELVNIVEEIKPRRIMEIGSLTGGSLKFWEQLLPVGGLLISVDQSPHLFDYPAWNWKGSDRNIVVIVKDSLLLEVNEIKKVLDNNDDNSDNLLDFLFIDGCHDIRHTQNDFDKFSGLVRKGGIVGFDDMYNVEGGTARVLFPLLSHANEWTMPTLDGSLSGIDHVPYAQKSGLYKPLWGKCMVIFKGSGVGVWWKE